MSIHHTARFQHSLVLSVTCLALCDGQQVTDSNDGDQVTVLLHIASECEALIFQDFCIDYLKTEMRQKH